MISGNTNMLWGRMEARTSAETFWSKVQECRMEKTAFFLWWSWSSKSMRCQLHIQLTRNSVWLLTSQAMLKCHHHIQLISDQNCKKPLLPFWENYSASQNKWDNYFFFRKNKRAYFAIILHYLDKSYSKFNPENELLKLSKTKKFASTFHNILPCVVFAYLNLIVLNYSRRKGRKR